MIDGYFDDYPLVLRNYGFIKRNLILRISSPLKFSCSRPQMRKARVRDRPA